MRPGHEDPGHPSDGSLKDVSLLSSDRVSVLDAKMGALCFSFLKNINTIAPKPGTKLQKYHLIQRKTTKQSLKTIKVNLNIVPFLEEPPS